MTRALTARRLATGAAVSGGGVGLAFGALFALLKEEARAARRKVEARTAKADPPSGDGIYGRRRGKSLVFAVLGDSSAVGLGVTHAAETPGALIAAALTELAERPVRLVRVAVTGAESRELAEQVDRALAEHPDVALIMIGANDVTTLTKPAVAVRHLENAVRRLTAAGCEVVVGTCPDLGTIRPIQPPLRWVARRASRTLAAAQTIAVVEAGGRSVSLGDLLGPEFMESPAEMFSADRFHPSAEGYSAAAAALLPSVAAALGLWDPADDAPSRARGEGVLPLAQAAVEAADAAGTEVSGAALAGRDRGTLGRWAQLRHRIRLFTAAPADPAVPLGGRS